MKINYRIYIKFYFNTSKGAIDYGAFLYTLFKINIKNYQNNTLTLALDEGLKLF